MCIRDSLWAKFPLLVFEVWRSQGFWVIAYCELDLLTPKSKQHIYEHKYICDQNWVKFPLIVFEIWGSQGFQDAETHSQMDRPKCSMPPAQFWVMAEAYKTTCSSIQTKSGLGVSMASNQELDLIYSTAAWGRRRLTKHNSQTHNNAIVWNVRPAYHWGQCYRWRSAW